MVTLASQRSTLTSMQAHTLWIYFSLLGLKKKFTSIWIFAAHLYVKSRKKATKSVSVTSSPKLLRVSDLSQKSFHTHHKMYTFLAKY